MRLTVLVATLCGLLGACATAPVVDAPTAINGRPLDTATNLFGRWDEKVSLRGRPNYIWRRAVILQGKTYYCELRAVTGFRDTISSSIVEGFPAACGLFAVQYTAVPERPRDEPQVVRQERKASCPNCRPVGGPQETASATDLGRDAASRR